MKKLLFISMLSMTAFQVSAQKGSLYIGGQGAFTHSSDKTKTSSATLNGGKTTNWSFSPEIGTFLTNNIQLGLAFTMNGSSSDDQVVAPNNGTTSSFNVGPTVYVRNFFGKQNFRPFVGLNVGYNAGNSKTRLNDSIKTEDLTSGFGANLNAGFAYGLSKRVAVVGSVATLGFSSTMSKAKNSTVENYTTDFGLDANTLGNRFNIGVYYTFYTPRVIRKK